MLRLGAGETVEVFDGRGGCGRFLVLEASRRGLALELVLRRDDDREAAVEVTLAVAPPSPKRLLSLVEKATELGVARFVPIVTERTSPRARAAKPARLARRALEAAKQCGRNRVPEVSGPVGLERAIASSKHDLALVGEAAGEGEPLARVLRAADPRPRSAIVAVGPEGGFTEAERAALAAAGFRAVSLGRATLRVETAALALLACVLYELGGG